MFGKPSVYSSPEWMTIPFVDMPRDAHQRLTDIELMVPRCMEMLEVLGNLRVCFEAHIPAKVDVQPCRKLTTRLLTDLANWATEFPNLTTICKDPHVAQDVMQRSGTGLDIANEDSTKSPLPDTFISVVATIYFGVRLILNMLMYKMDTQSSTESTTSAGDTANYLHEASQSADAILAGVANMNKAQTPAFDTIRSIVPLIFVVCVGPRSNHFQEASAMLQRLGAKVDGLGSIMDMHMLPSSARRKA